MASIKIDEHSASITLDNGTVIPVPDNYMEHDHPRRRSSRVDFIP